ncbi:methionine ABC transporter permease [Ileibacterium valens]|uniref:ABC transporter permease n=1 Tax=Ileibacterium valens TaxID=1862668 RepID=A0A1U7NHM8_9FIRM|nr:methionine ABC transporter permease [Ileibacterium valens]OLU38306.1 ABC transporter permease [Erysipelotrichaceae bacterium NYU-BL-E8]OLU40631.1 ABC transporter permease [Erysipelotrichaceae bacterium NYU-BL-F16]OLU41403.1 ABC transporter permease [Ileibacterium valens]
MSEWFPNVQGLWSEFITAFQQTCIMLVWSGSISFLGGLILGIALVITAPKGLCENRTVHQILGFVVNLFRSIPFIILLTWVMPVTRLIMGTAINLEGAIVPLIFGTIPFFSRQVESALSSVPYGLIEAARAMGDSNWQVIFRVYLKESIAPLARAVTITLVSLLGLTAMAGAVGSGGLGDFAIRYGHDRNMQDITWLVVISIVILVCIIEVASQIIIRRHTYE